MLAALSSGVNTRLGVCMLSDDMTEDASSGESYAPRAAGFNVSAPGVIDACFALHHCTALVVIGISIVSAMVALLLLNCFCWQQRGIGLIGIIELYPGRAVNEVRGILTLGFFQNVYVQNSAESSVELGKWRPWRRSPTAWRRAA